MKSKPGGPNGSDGVRRAPPVRIGKIRPMELRMEWMDPMSWKLPSGKALAEFALQAGFLAPLMFGGPRIKRVKKAASPRSPEAGLAEKQLGGGPERSGTFRETK